MSKKLQAIRGMNDILPEDLPAWYKLETIASDVFRSYGYSELRLPIVEKTELFCRTIGEVTDIVEKEMYTFDDRNQESLTLRPEGTASCVRACVEHGLLHNQQQRLWYRGPMFRYEKPQQGRYRQFHQIGVEAFGCEGPDIDAEQIMMIARLWQRLGIKNVELQVNSLGTSESRAKYRETLVAYFQANIDVLDEESKRRLERNPLRILDSKNPEMSELLANAPVLTDYLDEVSTAHFEKLLNLLETVGIKYVLNPRLVRGLDYYSNTVFEWVTTDLGAQGTICAGGRYDSLVEMIGGKPTPAVGFALGMERVIALIQLNKALVPVSPEAFVVVMDDENYPQAYALIEKIRDNIAGVRIVVNSGGGSVKSQFKRADKSGASIAIVLGSEEIKNNVVNVKYLREEKAQQTVNFDALVAIINDYKTDRTNEWGEST